MSRGTSKLGVRSPTHLLCLWCWSQVKQRPRARVRAVSRTRSFRRRQAAGPSRVGTSNCHWLPILPSVWDIKVTQTKLSLRIETFWWRKIEVWESNGLMINKELTRPIQLDFKKILFVFFPTPFKLETPKPTCRDPTVRFQWGKFTSNLVGHNA